MARPAKPIELHLLNGNKRHLTQQEIADRQQQEAKLKSGARTYKPSQQVKQDKNAIAMFRKLQRLYKRIDYVESLDENIINRYCLVHAEYIGLVEERKALQVKIDSTDDVMVILTMMDTVISIDKGIYKKMDMLMKLEDRLFLNPTARIKNVPRKEEEIRDLFGEMFD